MMLKPTVLKAFTTLAPWAQAATCSAPEVVVPYSRPARLGKSGLVASMSTLPDRSPNPSTTVLAAGQGVANSSRPGCGQQQQAGRFSRVLEGRRTRRSAGFGGQLPHLV